MSFTLSIGGENHYVIDSAETTTTNHTFQINTDDSDGKIVFKLGASSGTESCFKVLDSDGNDILDMKPNKKVIKKGDFNVHGTIRPDRHEFLRFSSLGFGNEKDERDVQNNQIIYTILNLIDLCGYTGILKINKVRWYITDCIENNFATIQFAIYKLKTSATFGDLTTYDNSDLVALSNKVHWNVTSGDSRDGLGFITFNLGRNVEISHSTDGVENRYFVAILCSGNLANGANIYKCHCTGDVGLPSLSKENFFYMSSTSKTTLDYNMVNNRLSNSFCPYYSLFYKRYTKNSWISENNQKYYIDSQGRKYRLLIKQDIEKTLSGAVQSATGWAVDSVSILATNTYWNGSVLATVAYPDPETESEFLDMRGDETGSNPGFQWEEYRDYEGLLEMKMEWPGVVDQGYNYNRTSSRSYPFNFEDAQGNVTDYMTWKQSVTPTTSSLTITNSRVGTGYEAISEGINSQIQNGTFAGIEFVGMTKHNTLQTYNDGGANGGTKWYFAAGAFNLHLNGIPVFTTSSANSDKVVVNKVNLWLRVPDPRDVYLLLGQSNMVGDGVVSEISASYWTQIPSNKFWNAGTPSTNWSQLTLGTTSDNAANFGPEVAFGKTIRLNNGTSHIFKYSVNGTDLANDWAARTGTQYTTLMSRLKDALNTDMTKKYRIRGIMWLQGEADASNQSEANAYEANLKNFIKCLREDFSNPKLPFVIAKVNCPLKTYRDTVRSAQEAVAASDPYVGIFSTDDCPLSDNLHYNTSGQIIIGERFYTTLQTIDDGVFKDYE